MPIGLKISYKQNINDVSISFYKLFNIKIDLDHFIHFHLSTKQNRNRLSI